MQMQKAIIGKKVGMTQISMRAARSFRSPLSRQVPAS